MGGVRALRRDGALVRSSSCLKINSSRPSENPFLCKIPQELRSRWEALGKVLREGRYKDSGLNSTHGQGFFLTTALQRSYYCSNI